MKWRDGERERHLNRKQQWQNSHNQAIEKPTHNKNKMYSVDVMCPQTNKLTEKKNKRMP